MDEFKPEDELKPDPGDRRTGRSRQASERGEPQINFDDVDLDEDERRPARGRQTRLNERAREDEYESSDDIVGEERAERYPRRQKKAAATPASRQYMMMGIGVLVLLLLIVGIGSALKSPTSPSGNQTASGERSIALSGDDDADRNIRSQTATDAASAEQTAGGSRQDIALPPIASTPTQGQAPAVSEGQQRVEVQGNLNNALTQDAPQINDAVVNSTLPTEPATVAPVRGGSAQPHPVVPSHSDSAPRQTAAHHTAPARPERKQTAIEPKKTQPAARTTPAGSKPAAQAKPSEPAAMPKAPAVSSAPAATTAPKATASAAPAQTATPAAKATASPVPAQTATNSAKSTGNVGALKSAPAGHYTLQLSSSSNYDNLNGWAKKENLKNYVVYQTTRNGQPWYVLVTGVYASKEDAKRAVSTLPADVQAKNPWAKPLRQVQADLK
ncbi:cell division protein DamX [Intestinirhabdus alba]|jgi:DamX protein|uniref:Cell division protein DamX n=1 Tax=Intestinirhabdus alba TaxID=2899544 RepID=A0A6L6IRS2_9ENTR|nr:cell division protein DamX [Intestinirhabdus alba]MTH47730.1 cell division protein DamX [Intestinirhabdus alba]